MGQLAGRWAGVSCTVFTNICRHTLEILHTSFIYIQMLSTFTFISLYVYTEMWKGGMERERKT